MCPAKGRGGGGVGIVNGEPVAFGEGPGIQLEGVKEWGEMVKSV